MYTEFFGLHEKPFTITPDPRYLFMSERHGEGLAHLVYGVTESGGFIQLTGEVGTGKTTLVRTLLGQIPATVDIALVLNPHLTAVEFLTAICEELSIELPRDRTSSKALVDALNRYLLDAHARGRRTILMVDEAQNLSEDVLEQLRLLTNLETAKQKLLQIILVAQPELREKLAHDSLRQLAQRVTGRYHLEPLSREETFDYIDHRLRVAGALTEIFDAAAKKEIFRLSGGVPRIINVICDRALLGAYSRESRAVSGRLVRKAGSEVSGQTIRPATLNWLVPVLALAGLILAGSVLWNYFAPGRQTTGETTEVPAQIEAAEAAAVDEPAAMATPTTSGEAAAPAPGNGPPPVNVEDLIARSSDVGSFRSLLGLWGVDYDPQAGPVCDQAETHGLRCYFQRGTWSTVAQLDRPVVLTLTDEAGVTHRLALVGLEGDVAVLAVDDESVRVPTSALADYWFGQFMLVWRPANGSDQAIGPGMRGETVLWLRQSLAAIDADSQPSAAGSELYDSALEQQVIAFQRQHRLEADGLAGQKTQIIINTLLANNDAPRLTMSN
jgi:general secretion pathway protein A